MMTDKGKAYKMEVSYMVKGLMVRQGLRRSQGLVALTLRLHPARKGIFDLDNRLKIIQDSLNQICFEDDSQVDEVHLYRGGVVKKGKVILRLDALHPNES